MSCCCVVVLKEESLEEPNIVLNCIVICVLDFGASGFVLIASAAVLVGVCHQWGAVGAICSCCQLVLAAASSYLWYGSARFVVQRGWF